MEMNRIAELEAQVRELQIQIIEEKSKENVKYLPEFLELKWLKGMKGFLHAQAPYTSNTVAWAIAITEYPSILKKVKIPFDGLLVFEKVMLRQHHHTGEYSFTTEDENSLVEFIKKSEMAIDASSVSHYKKGIELLSKLPNVQWW